MFRSCSRSGAVPLVCGSYVRLLIPKSSLLDSVLIHLLNIYINRMMASGQPQIYTNFLLCIKCYTGLRMASEWPQTGGKSQGAIIPEQFFGFSGRLSGQFEAIWGEGCRKIFFIWVAEELKYISDIFVTNKYVLLCFYFYR